MTQFPKMLYKEGGSLVIRGVGSFDTVTVHSEEEHAEFKKDGWSEEPSVKKRGRPAKKADDE